MAFTLAHPRPEPSAAVPRVAIGLSMPPAPEAEEDAEGGGTAEQQEPPQAEEGQGRRQGGVFGAIKRTASFSRKNRRGGDGSKSR